MELENQEVAGVWTLPPRQWGTTVGYYMYHEDLHLESLTLEEGCDGLGVDAWRWVW